MGCTSLTEPPAPSSSSSSPPHTQACSPGSRVPTVPLLHGGTMRIIKNPGAFPVGSRLWVSVSQLRSYWNPTQLPADSGAPQRGGGRVGAGVPLQHTDTFVCRGADGRFCITAGTDIFYSSASLRQSIRLRGIVEPWGHVGWTPPHPEMWRTHSIRQL